MPTFEVGNSVTIVCSRLSLDNVPATVTRVDLLGTSSGIQCTTGDGNRYAFFGAEVDECVLLVTA